MKPIEEMRINYWSDESIPLYPTLTSPSKLAVRYNHAEYAVDSKHMNEARRHAQRAVIFNWLSQEQKSECAFNEANAYLAGAMQIEGKNEAFWRQF